MLVYACNSRTWEAEVGGSWVGGQPGVCSDNFCDENFFCPFNKALIFNYYSRPHINMNTKVYGATWYLVIWTEGEEGCLSPRAHSEHQPQPSFPAYPVTKSDFLRWYTGSQQPKLYVQEFFKAGCLNIDIIKNQIV
jgi:hypothetical protein